MRANFDALARPYFWMERIAFGRDLERARFCHLDALANSRRVLILGEGDGRFLAELLRRSPTVRAAVVDSSDAMLASAKARLSESERDRVQFRHEDALEATFDESRYDAVVTLFFLDCFSADELGRLIPAVKRALRPNAVWLWGDFVVPPRGWRRGRAILWLALLYRSFRWLTGLGARALPPSEELLAAHGFRLAAARSFQAGLLRSAVFVAGAVQKPEPPRLP